MLSKHAAEFGCLLASGLGGCRPPCCSFPQGLGAYRTWARCPSQAVLPGGRSVCPSTARPRCLCVCVGVGVGQSDVTVGFHGVLFSPPECWPRTRHRVRAQHVDPAVCPSPSPPRKSSGSCGLARGIRRTDGVRGSVHRRRPPLARAHFQLLTPNWSQPESIARSRLGCSSGTGMLE